MDAAMEQESSSFAMDGDTQNGPSTDHIVHFNGVPENLRHFNVLDEVEGDSGSDAEEGNMDGEGKIISI